MSIEVWKNAAGDKMVIIGPDVHFHAPGPVSFEPRQSGLSRFAIAWGKDISGEVALDDPRLNGTAQLLPSELRDVVHLILWLHDFEKI